MPAWSAIPIAALARAPRRRPLPRGDGAHRRADRRRRPRLARRQGAAARTCRSSGAAGTRRCSAASAWRSRASTSPCRRRARTPSRRSATGWRPGDGHELKGCAGLRLPRRRTATFASEPAAPARRRQPLPPARLHPAPRRALLRAQRASGSSTISRRRAAPSAAPSAPIPSSTSASGWGWSRSGWARRSATLWQRYRFDDCQLPGRDLLHLPADGSRRSRRSFSAARLPITWAATMRADQGDRLTEEALANCKQLGAAPRHDRRRIRIAGDDGPHQEGHQARAGASSAPRRCRRHGIAGDLPLHRRLSRASRTRACAPRSTSPSACAR